MARPKAHKPTERDRETVKAMVKWGIPQTEIAGVLKISEPTLRKHYREEINSATPEMIRMVADSLFKQALDGNVTAGIFILKARGGWKERVDVTTGGEVMRDKHGQEVTLNQLIVQIAGNATERRMAGTDDQKALPEKV